MKVAFCYKGTFNIGYIRKYGVDQIMISKLGETIQNNIDFIFNVFDKLGYTYDIFISSYDVDHRITQKLILEYEPKKCSFVESNFSTISHIPQLNHLNNLIEMIVDEEICANSQYDLFVFTRPDIKMFKKFDELKIDFTMFNSILKNEGGNCCDNFFIFPRSYFEIFKNSVNSLLESNQIVHRINHEIIGRGGSVNYMEELNRNIYMGHKAFEFVRCGSNPDDTFDINSNFVR